jgi:hypothetical protein
MEVADYSELLLETAILIDNNHQSPEIIREKSGWEQQAQNLGTVGDIEVIYVIYMCV